MRETKYKAWDKKNKEWLFNSALLMNADGKLCCCYSDKTHGEWAIDYEIVFYTGLKDKNGKEIYEGDVVNHNNLTSIIIFDDGCFKWSCERVGLMGLIGEPMEVIGNIYENPELLIKKDK